MATSDGMHEAGDAGESRVLLFVYGSLRRGAEHHAELRGAPFVGTASTASGYGVVSLGHYPALVRTRESGRVEGEVFSVAPEDLVALDAFEDCPRLYRRELIELADGRRVHAYLSSEP